MPDTWYCVQTPPCTEHYAVRELRDIGFRVLLPRIKILTRTKQLPSYVRVLPLFRGYLFITFDLLSPEWRKIHRCAHVKRLMSSSPEMPTMMPPAAMDGLIGLLGPDGTLDRTGARTGPAYRPGDRLTVTGGPLSGWEGVCTQSGPDRVRVLLTMLGAEREVGVDTAKVALAA